MSNRKPNFDPQRRLETDAGKQYERCMVDSAEIIEYKKSGDITIDEVAELRCKNLACRIQICMSMPMKQKPVHRDVYTGELYNIGDSCATAHSDFIACVEKEKQNLINSGIKD
jgi:hypothetical protein